MTTVPSPRTSRQNTGGPRSRVSSGHQPVSVPSGILPHRSPQALLRLARKGLSEASGTSQPGLRYATAHLAALRIATAVLAARAQPDPRKRRGRPATVWTLLAMVAPELTEWALFFAAGATKRAAAEAGIPRVVTGREADDLIRDAERFLALVEMMLGVPHQTSISSARVG